MATELQVISDFYDLACYLSQRLEKFPRSHWYTLGADIERRVQEILGQLIRTKYAASPEAKRDRLGEVNIELEILRFQLRLANELRALPSHSHGHVCGLVQKIGGQVGGWLRSLRGAASGPGSGPQRPGV